MSKEIAQDFTGDVGSVLASFDFFSREHNKLKWHVFAEARSTCPVAQTESNGGSWLVTRYDDVRGVLEDWETFSSVNSTFVPAGISLCPIDVDPPVQSAVRRELNPLFSRSALAPYEPAMRDAARRLIGNWVERGTVEVLSEFASPYVGQLLTKVVFNDMTSDELAHAQELAVEVAENASAEIYGELFSTCTEYLRRAKRGGVPDGVVARLIDCEVDGKAIAEEQQVGALAILLIGGLDTTKSAIGSIVYRVSQEPYLEFRLRDPSWIRRDLDEFLRLDSPVPGMMRTATRDVELGGVTIKRGERVQLRYDSANRDDSRFSNPDALTFDEPRGGHTAFGLGVHRCIGSNMARMQIEVAFDELLARIENIRLAPGAEINWVPGLGNSLEKVDIVFDKLD